MRHKKKLVSVWVCGCGPVCNSICAGHCQTKSYDTQLLSVLEAEMAVEVEVEMMHDSCPQRQNEPNRAVHLITYLMKLHRTRRKERETRTKGKERKG